MPSKQNMMKGGGGRKAFSGWLRLPCRDGGSRHEADAEPRGPRRGLGEPLRQRVERPLTREREDDAGIEDAERIEGVLHEAKPREHLSSPDGLDEWSAESSVAVLTGKGSAEAGDASGDFLEDGLEGTSHAGSAEVDERVDVEVAVAGMSEDDGRQGMSGEDVPEEADVLG